MLLIQKVDLTWNKDERGAENARARRRFPLTYLWDKPISGNVAVQDLSFFQRGEDFLDAFHMMCQGMENSLPSLGFTRDQIQQEIDERALWMKRHQFQCYQSVKDLKLTNLSVQSCPDGFQVSFFYDEHRSGMPYRRGHNQYYQDIRSSFCQKDCINETAFILMQGQYGRILWNERNTDYDTGEWYYQLHVYNMFYLEDKSFRADIFVVNQPNFEYRQLAQLR